jgi:hypothetical protein
MLATTTLLEVNINNMFRDSGFDQKSGSNFESKALHMMN